MPITSPFESNSGPPELPWLIGASVWMKLSYGEAMMSRLSALTIPEVTDMPMPSGLPIASTGSPTCTLLLSAQLVAGSVCPTSTLMTARSTSGAAFTSVAGACDPSEKVTTIS